MSEIPQGPLQVGELYQWGDFCALTIRCMGADVDLLREFGQQTLGSIGMGAKATYTSPGGGVLVVKKVPSPGLTGGFHLEIVSVTY
jgi:hypothetical protein